MIVALLNYEINKNLKQKFLFFTIFIYVTLKEAFNVILILFQNLAQNNVYFMFFMRNPKKSRKKNKIRTAFVKFSNIII